MRAMPRVAFASIFLLLAACASTTTPIPADWTTVPAATRIPTVTLGYSQGPVDTPVRVEGNRLMRGDKALTEVFTAIDSYDYSASRDEVVFSAKRGASFDIGLAAGDGSVTNWVPADPADELKVQWAPRGSKVSYIVRATLGDVVRTLHIPTSFQYAIDFGPARIHAVAWDTPAERYAVAYSTIDASDRVEVLRYDGSDRKVTQQPSSRIAAEVLPFATGAHVLRPFGVGYNEKLPVVVWVADSLAWSDARGALMKNARAAMIVTLGPPGADVWTKIRETAWLDASRVYVVNAIGEGAVSIVGDDEVPAGRYRGSGNVVAVAPAAIQSFAAGFITEQLKRTSHTNGSSR
jgi:hypothetical protein